jgi:hypothetical protein
MSAYINSSLLRRILALVAVVAAAAWWLTVPDLITSSTFVALLAFLAGAAWVLKSTYENAQPASSLAQSLHDIETAAAVKRARRSSNQ